MNGRRTPVNARTRRRAPARATSASALGRAAAACAVVPFLAALLAGSAQAQAGLTRTHDAEPVPRGMARLRVMPFWSRFETRFTGSSADGPSTVPLAAAVAAESLGVAQIPGLSTSEAALRTLTGDQTFRLSLGRSISTATSRIVTTAIAGEVGITRRLTLGAMLPIVQARTELFVALNAEDATRANVGPNPARPAGSAGTVARNRAVALQAQLASVRTALQTRLAACDANPSSDPSCATILANRSDVVSLLDETGAFGSAVGVLFGTSQTAPVQPFAPLDGTTTAVAISNRLTTLTGRLRTYVGSTADQITQTVPLAVGPAGFGNLQDLFLQGEFGLSPDSLGPSYRFNVGDVELSAKLLVLEHGAWTVAPGARSPWLRTRLSLLGVVRLGTGTPTLERLPHRYLEYGTGDGQTDLEGGAFLDLGLGPRLTLMAGARYTRQLGEVDAGRIPDESGVINPFTPLHDGTRRLGDIFVGELTPRYTLGRLLAVDAHYAAIIRADDEYSPITDGEAPLRRGGFTEQRVGAAISYSTLRGARGRIPRLPVEVSIAHIETIAGSSAIVPRASRQQFEVRLYYQLWR
jgi:hypothetical protein